MSTAPVTLDMSTATPIQQGAPVTLDMSTAAPIGSGAQPGWLDKTIPLDSYAHATESGVQSVARGVRDAGVGLYDTVRHPIDTLKGVAALPSQAAQVPAAIHDINQNAPDPTGTYLHVASDTAGQGAGQAIAALATAGVAKGAGALAEKIPSAARAGAVFQDIKATAGDVPLDVSKVGNSALELWDQADRGANLPPAVRKLVLRLSRPGSEPITYEEGKDFQSNISNLSANEKMNLKPNTVRLLGQLNSDLKDSLGDAADTVGKGQKFADAMKEYHQAMKLKGFSDSAISSAWKIALGAVGAREVAKIFGIGQ